VIDALTFRSARRDQTRIRINRCLPFDSSHPNEDPVLPRQSRYDAEEMESKFAYRSGKQVNERVRRAAQQTVDHHMSPIIINPAQTSDASCLFIFSS
jgi:hypothetical protein